MIWHMRGYCYGSIYVVFICRFWLFCCGVFPSWGIQQSACVNSGPADRSVRGVYIPQAAVLHVFIHTFLPGLSWATTTSVPLHIHLFDSCDWTGGSADMTIPAEPSSANGRGDLLQAKRGIELHGSHSDAQFHTAYLAHHCSVSTLQASHVKMVRKFETNWKTNILELSIFNSTPIPIPIFNSTCSCTG